MNLNSDKITSENMFVIQIHGAATIPIGHRVEILIFYSNRGYGLFWKDEPKPQLEYPLITDLETGIQYGNLSQFYDLNHAYKDNQLFDASIDVLQHL